MTIAEVGAKCKERGKGWWAAHGRLPRDLIIVGVLLTASILSFGLGYLTGQDQGKQDKTGQGSAAVVETVESTSTPQSATQIVASKFGTKYYLSTCSGAARITAANKVTFTSAAAAKAAGYSPATNCTGL